MHDRVIFAARECSVQSSHSFQWLNIGATMICFVFPFIQQHGLLLTLHSSCSRPMPGVNYVRPESGSLLHSRAKVGTDYFSDFNHPSPGVSALGSRQ